MELVRETKSFIVKKEELMEALGFPETAKLIDIFATENGEGYEFAVMEEQKPTMPQKKKLFEKLTKKNPEEKKKEVTPVEIDDEEDIRIDD